MLHAIVEVVDAAHVVGNPLHEPERLAGTPTSGPVLEGREQPRAPQRGRPRQRQAARVALLAALTQKKALGEVRGHVARVHVILDVGAERGEVRVLFDGEAQQDDITLERREPEQTDQRLQGWYPALFVEALTAS